MGSWVYIILPSFPLPPNEKIHPVGERLKTRFFYRLEKNNTTAPTPPPKKNYPPKKRSSPVQSLAQSSQESSPDFPLAIMGPLQKKKKKKKQTATFSPFHSYLKCNL